MASCRWMRGGRHLIRLRPNRPADEVSRSILHELVHAEQAEAHGSATAWGEAYGKASAAVSDDREVAYRLNAFEREARAIEDEFADAFKLAASV
jgi:hypothetical protein